MTASHSSWGEFFWKEMVMGSPARCPLARIAFIDRAIRAGGWPNANTLARQLEVSPRTVQ